jgi:hypothetical protein
MGPITGLEVLEKRKFFCGRPFRNLITIPTELTNKNKTKTKTITMELEAVEVIVQHQFGENKMQTEFCWRKVAERDCWKTSA